MKIIILSILLTSQAQFIDDQLDKFVSNFDTSTNNYFSLFTNKYNNNEINLSTYESETLSSSYYTTIINEILFKKEQWLNINQNNKSNLSSIFWRKINNESTYILKSDGRCIREICRVKLKYNHLLSNKKEGCLSFILLTRGQPVGQLWIEEDQEQESFSQKIQLTNSSLRIEHSLKSKIKNLSIDARILFRNSKIDIINLSNLNINWKGPCPKQHSKVTSITNIFTDQSTFENNLMTLTTEHFTETSILTTYDRFESSSQENYFIESSTKKTSIKRSSSFLNQTNIGWILSLIILFCLLVILSSIIYGLWTIQGHYRFIWYLPFDSPIQFFGRRSIRSSTRSENKIETLQQISNQIFHINFQQDHFDNFSTNSSRSTLSAFHAYF